MSYYTQFKLGASCKCCIVCSQGASETLHMRQHFGEGQPAEEVTSSTVALSKEHVGVRPLQVSLMGECTTSPIGRASRQCHRKNGGNLQCPARSVTLTNVVFPLASTRSHFLVWAGKAGCCACSSGLLPADLTAPKLVSLLLVAMLYLAVGRMHRKATSAWDAARTGMLRQTKHRS